MENTDKPLTRDALISMQVIDAKGRLVGKVKDIAFAVGKTGIALSVENEAGEIKHIPWEDVQAAADFIILKPASQMTSSMREEKKVSMPEQSTQQQKPIQAALSARKKRFLDLMSSSSNQLKLKFKNRQLSHFARHAVNLSHGFRNTRDGTATMTKNTFQ